MDSASPYVFPLARYGAMSGVGAIQHSWGAYNGGKGAHSAVNTSRLVVNRGHH